MPKMFAEDNNKHGAEWLTAYIKRKYHHCNVWENFFLRNVIPPPTSLVPEHVRRLEVWLLIWSLNW